MYHSLSFQKNYISQYFTPTLNCTKYCKSLYSEIETREKEEKEGGDNIVIQIRSVSVS